jgi:hypothetical protein
MYRRKKAVQRNDASTAPISTSSTARALLRIPSPITLNPDLQDSSSESLLEVIEDFFNHDNKEEEDANNDVVEEQPSFLQSEDNTPAAFGSEILAVPSGFDTEVVIPKNFNHDCDPVEDVAKIGGKLLMENLLTFVCCKVGASIFKQQQQHSVDLCIQAAIEFDNFLKNYPLKEDAQKLLKKLQQQPIGRVNNSPLTWPEEFTEFIVRWRNKTMESKKRITAAEKDSARGQPWSSAKLENFLLGEAVWNLQTAARYSINNDVNRWMRKLRSGESMNGLLRGILTDKLWKLNYLEKAKNAFRTMNCRRIKNKEDPENIEAY